MLFKEARVFRQLILLQDRYAEADPFNTDLQQEAYREIAKKFKTTESEVRRIALQRVVEGRQQPKIKR